MELEGYQEKKDEHFDRNVASTASQIGYPAILGIARQWLCLEEIDIIQCEVSATETLPVTKHMSSCGLLFLWHSEEKKKAEFSFQLSREILQLWCKKNTGSCVLHRLWQKLEEAKEVYAASSRTWV